MIVRRFAEFALAQRAAPLTADLTNCAARAVVDWFAAAVVGGRMRPAQILTRTLVDEDETGHARLVPDGRGTRPRTAALINGTASHSAEVDDIYRDGVYHPGSPAIAAALAVAEHVDASGATLLRAVVIGYEVGGRIAAAVQPEHYRYWHTTGTVGTIAAAAAAAEVLALDVDRFTHALATATTMAAGVQQSIRSDAMSKVLHAGHAADAGVLAVMAAARGLTGAPDVLEGPAGFAVATAKPVDWACVLAGLGQPWAVTIVTVKNHSCCGHTFAAIDAMLALRAQGAEPGRVREIHVTTYAVALDVAGIPAPRTANEAKFSIAYCVAAALVLGSVRLAAFTDEKLVDPMIRDLMAKVVLRAAPAFDAAYPHQRGSNVVVIDEEGHRYEDTRMTRKGDPDSPLTDRELTEKFTELVSPVLGAPGCARLSDALWALARLPRVRDLPMEATDGEATPR